MHWPRHQLKYLLFIVAFNVLALGHYLGWVQIFDPQATFQMRSLDSICPSSGANPWLCNWQKSLTPLQPLKSSLYGLKLVWYKGLQLFYKLVATHRPSYLAENFRTLIRQSKGLYSTALLSSLCAPWSTGAF